MNLSLLTWKAANEASRSTSINNRTQRSGTSQLSMLPNYDMNETTYKRQSLSIKTHL